MEIKYKLRNATAEDYSFVLNLLKENMYASFVKHWGSWKDESFKRDYRIENIRIIEIDGSPIGYIDFKFKKDCGYINNIQISKEYAGKGLGTDLMKLLEKETSSYGLNRICLKVFKDNPAVRLYNRLGYTSIWEDEGSRVMEKKI